VLIESCAKYCTAFIKYVINHEVVLYMRNFINIKGVNIGEGSPKICVSMVGRTMCELKEEAENLQTADFDIVEWRSDYFEDVKDIDKVKEALKTISSLLVNKPLLFTFRSVKEGGQREIDTDLYIELNKSILKTKLVDIIDVELFNLEKDVEELVKVAHEVEVSVIISSHDFKKTPKKEDIVARLCRAHNLGADISKVAVMPNCTEDVITLLDATREVKEEYSIGPIITISMSGRGLISRLAGEVFGSDITFGGGEKISAPGRIPVVDLRNIIKLLHNNL